MLESERASGIGSQGVDITAEQFRFDGTSEDAGLMAEIEKAQRDFLARWEENEGLFTQSQAATMLGVTRQTVLSLVERGYLKKIELEQGIYVSGRSIKARAAGQKGKPGRPRLIDSFDLGKSWNEK